MATRTNRVARSTRDPQDRTDNQGDDSKRPDNADVQQKSDDQQNDT
jgi:hypothetical protein